jgi:hypothetical protein
MANRTVIVDNNTWNNTHIATVGRAMASNEEDAYEIMQVRCCCNNNFSLSLSYNATNNIPSPVYRPGLGRSNMGMQV